MYQKQLKVERNSFNKITIILMIQKQDWKNIRNNNNNKNKWLTIFIMETFNILIFYIKKNKKKNKR